MLDESIDYRLQRTDYREQITEYRLQRTDNRVQSTENRLQRTDYRVQSTKQIANQFSLAGEGVAATQSLTREWKKEEKQKVESRK